jgi:hypothetical protein
MEPINEWWEGVKGRVSLSISDPVEALDQGLSKSFPFYDALGQVTQEELSQALNRASEEDGKLDLNPQAFDELLGILPVSGVAGTTERVISKVDDFVAGLSTKRTPLNRPADLFEIEQTGELNFRVSGGGTQVDIDGFTNTTILEAKFIDKPGRSPFIEDSNIPPFIREKIHREQRNEFERLNAVIQDPKVPFNRLEVRINDQRGIPYFQSLIDEFQIPGNVRAVETQIKQSGN